MNPIWERGGGKTIGYNIEDFHERFAAICAEHLETNRGRARAKAFAFIFYNTGDANLPGLLADLGVFAELDRLSERSLSIFYLASEIADAKRVSYFNSHFLSLLHLAGETTPPCVVFFKMKRCRVRDVRAVQLSGDSVHALHELYGVIERYIKDEALDTSAKPKPPGWIRSSMKFISTEAFRAALKELFGQLFRLKDGH